MEGACRLLGSMEKSRKSQFSSCVGQFLRHDAPIYLKSRSSSSGIEYVGTKAAFNISRQQHSTRKTTYTIIFSQRAIHKQISKVNLSQAEYKLSRCKPNNLVQYATHFIKEICLHMVKLCKLHIEKLLHALWMKKRIFSALGWIYRKWSLLLLSESAIRKI